MTLKNILESIKGIKVSDIHFTVGSHVKVRTSQGLEDLGNEILSKEDTNEVANEILTKEKKKEFEEEGEVDLSFEVEGHGRYRCNIFRQSGSVAIALRVINSTIPSLEELGLPNIIKEISEKQRGLILVTGPTGSGKSTTLAAIIDYVNSRRNEHIITIEDPIEYIHSHKKSIINQREIDSDTKSFGKALRASLRQDPNIILVGEMRDLETISTAISAAETGHLVLSTLHTIGAAKTVDRIIDAFPPHQQEQIRTQLSMVLEGVISQQLLPRTDKSGRVASFEIMINTPAISNLIREGKTHQMQTVIQTGKMHGMELMDINIMKLYKKGTIDLETVKKYAVDFNAISNELRMM